MSAEVPDAKPVSFKDVFADELIEIRKSREARDVDATLNVTNTLTGLAFSGGGIRSATFNLGILQALAKKQVLCKFDYISTVSGGGYIGSWLAAFTRRFPQPSATPKFVPIQDALGEHTYEIGKSAEVPAIRWLRNYADYLTPQTGALSGDTGAMLGTWLRNVILNLIVVVLFLLGAILVPDFLVIFTRDVVGRFHVYTFFVGVFLLIVATVFMGLSMVDFIPWEKIRQKNWLRRNRVELGVMLPYFASAGLINASMWSWTDLSHSELWWWCVGGAIFYTIIWSATFSYSQQWNTSGPPIVSKPWMVVSAALSGVLGGFFFYRYNLILGHIKHCDAHVWSIGIFGTVAFMLLMQTVAVFQLGLLGIDCLDLVREWWARAGGRLIQVMGLWVLVFGIVVYGPLGVRLLLSKNIGGLLGALAAWSVSNLTGIMAAKSAKTGGDIKSASGVMKAVSDSKSTSWLKSPRVLEFIAQVAPYVFALGLLILLSTAVHILSGLFLAGDAIHTLTKNLWLVRDLWGSTSQADICQNYWHIQSSPSLMGVFWVAILLIVIAALFSWRVDINDFSLHHFYRNRLVRCYLGASRLRERAPQQFTGFDPHDDIPLDDFAHGQYVGPYPILNASLNVSRGGELGFQERKAKSFIFTPLYCGYDLAAKLADASPDGSYMPTLLGRSKIRFSRGITLGTAMAISGAAASPNMGHYTTPAAAFFMTLFDVRLGWWMGNPRHDEKWKKAGPSPALGYLLKELVAESDEESNYAYLSDGGHFENLAIYELVKRRCKFIMVCDSGADRGYGCGDLMEAIEKCKTDFGVDIKISVSEIKPAKDQCVSSKTFTLGSISYGPQEKGMLVYVKSSLPLDDPKAPVESRLAAGVRSYADAHHDFPHQSTADQWFDEVQFEAYRALGEYIGGTVANAILNLRHETMPETFQSVAPPAPDRNTRPEWLCG